MVCRIKFKTEKENEKVIDATNKVIMPGLINTHAHIAMSIFRGTFEGCNLYTWLSEKIWPIEDKLTEEDVYNASMISIIEMISTGTTCVNDHYFFSKTIREALEKANLRAVITRVLMDSVLIAYENEKENTLKKELKNLKNYMKQDVQKMT